MIVKSRKAQGAAGLVMAIGIITLLIITIYFLSTIQASLADKGTDKIESEVDDEITLLNYLRTPVNEYENIADLITRYRMTKDDTIKSQIQAKSAETLNPMFEGTRYSWKILLDNEEIAKGKRCTKVRSAKQEIILYDGKKAAVELDICD